MTPSDVWVEAVSPVVEPSDLISHVLLLLVNSSSVSEDLVLVLGVSETHVVREVCYHLTFIDIILVEELSFFLLKALEHSFVVGSRIQHAHVVHFFGLLEFKILVV